MVNNIQHTVIPVRTDCDNGRISVKLMRNHVISYKLLIFLMSVEILSHSGHGYPREAEHMRMFHL